jgi:hypothetical protein
MNPVMQLIVTTWTLSGRVNRMLLTITPTTGPHVPSFQALGRGVADRSPSNRRNMRQPRIDAPTHPHATRTRSAVLPPRAEPATQTVKAPNTTARNRPPNGQAIFRNNTRFTAGAYAVCAAVTVPFITDGLWPAAKQSAIGSAGGCLPATARLKGVA